MTGATGRARTTWGVGDYPQMAERLVPVARQAAELVHLRPGMRVLDVGCGTGTFGCLAAELGGQVVGLDAEPVLLEIARRLDRHGCQWRESDFSALDAGDGAFDVVASLFGVMYASDHPAAAAELARVCDPDGIVLLSAWTPGSFMPAFGRALGEFLPPPPAASPPPDRWGDRAALAAILAGAGLRIDACETGKLRPRFADDDQVSRFLIRTAGHLVAERERLVAEGRWSALERATQTVVEQHAVPTAQGVALPLEYLLATARPVR